MTCLEFQKVDPPLSSKIQMSHFTHACLLNVSFEYKFNFLFNNLFKHVSATNHFCHKDAS